MDELIRAVEQQTTTVDAAVALIEGLVAQYEAAATPEEIDAVTAAINANTQKLADAVASAQQQGGGGGGSETPPA